MAESLTSCELMRQCQWIQFQKDNHFTIFPQKYLKWYCKTENLLGMNADYAILSHPTRSQSPPVSFSKAFAPGCLCDSQMLGWVRNALRRTQPPRFISCRRRRASMSTTFQTNYRDVIVVHGISSHREPVTVHIWSAFSAAVGVMAFTVLYRGDRPG